MPSHQVVVVDRTVGFVDAFDRCRRCDRCRTSGEVDGARRVGQRDLAEPSAVENDQRSRAPLSIDGDAIAHRAIGSGKRVERGCEDDRLGAVGRRRLRETAQLRRERGPDERGVGNGASEFLGDERHLDGRRHRRTVARGAPKLAPGGADDRRVELRSPLGVLQGVDRARAEPIGQVRGGVAQCHLLGRKTDIHQIRAAILRLTSISVG